VPDLLALELDAHERYQELARVTSDEVFESYRPFAARVMPSELFGRLRSR